jgi:CxxC motif-containing protein
MMKIVKKKIRCTVCPEGCFMMAEFEEDSKKVIYVDGHNCKRGIKFAGDEIANPLRLLTTTINIDSKKNRRLAVRSNVPAPKEKIRQIIEAVKQKEIKAPVRAGDIIMANTLGTGVDIIASSTIEE